MFKMLSNFEKISVLFSSLAISGVLLFLCMKLRIPLTYSDFIVGSITWQADTKFQDLAAGPFFIIALFGFLWISMKLFEKIRNNYDSSCSYEYSSQLVLWSIPFLMQITRLLVSNEFQQFYFIISGIGILTLTLFIIYDLWIKRRPNPTLIGYSLLAIFLISLAPFELYMLYSRALILSGNHNIDWVPNLSFYFIVMSVIVYLFNFFMYLQENEHFKKYLSKSVLLGQILASLLYLCLIPVPFFQPDATVFMYSTTFLFKIIIFSLISYSMYDVISRYKNSKNELSTSLFSPFPIFAILLIILFGTTSPPYVIADDYHFGERLIGFWSILNGKIPYIDYFPSHGFIIDDLPALISYLFFNDLSVSSLWNSERISHACLSLIAFYSLYRFTANPFIPFLMLLITPCPYYIFMIPFICIWLSPYLIANPLKWITAWLITTPLLVLGIPGHGLILIASFSILFLYQLFNLFRYQKNHREAYETILYFLIITILLITLTPLFQMILGAIGYVYDNGSINIQAYGVSWQKTYSSSTGSASAFLFNSIKTSWIWVVVLSFLYFFYLLENKNIKNKLFNITCIPIFMFLILSYTMGRIDPGLSRVGILSLYSWAIFFPIIFLPIINDSKKIFIIIAFTTTSSLFGLIAPVQPFLSSSASKIQIPSLKEASKIGFNNLGNSIIEDEHWERLIRLKETLNSNLNSKESYLDLTSRNAQYFYMDRLPPLDITAPYNLVASSQQIRNINKLKNKIPRIALLEGDNIIHDGGGLALRSPLLYKFIFDNYRPVFKNGFILGLLRTEDFLHQPIDNAVYIPIKNFTDSNWSNGIHRIETAFITQDPIVANYLYIGQKIKLNSTEERTIISIRPEVQSIWLSGEKLDPSQTYDIQTVFEDSSDYELALFDRAFTVQKDLQKIPIAWGKSDSSLMKKLDLVISLTKQDSESNSEYLFDIENTNISGHDVGFLRFEYLSKSSTKLKIYWWGDNQNGYSECRSFAFDAKKGILIVPMDVYPRWLQLKKINGLKIVFDSPQSDINTIIKNISLLQRKPIS